MNPVVLDVTRTLSPKSIATPTGIDRVERAYVSHFLNASRDVLFVCKAGRGYRLMDRVEMKAVFASVLAGDQGARQRYKLGLLRGIGQRLGLRASPFPKAFTYLNVGHTHLSEAWLGAVRKAGAEKIIGMVHDMIPMDDPQFQTSASVTRFEKRMRALSGAADLIVSNSEHTKGRVAHWFGKWGARPEIISNPLGVEPLADARPFHSERPYFVVLGTIEPRKNHALLLEVWTGFQGIPEAERPILHIIGRRGWLNEEVFGVLDSSPMMGRDVFEHGSLSDLEVASYLRGARALLFPSLTEGYGLPLLEAILARTPTIASDIPVFRELGGSHTLYLDPFDVSIWKKIINEQAKQGLPADDTKDLPLFDTPKWIDHFARLEQYL